VKARNTIEDTSMKQGADSNMADRKSVVGVSWIRPLCVKGVSIRGDDGNARAGTNLKLGGGYHIVKRKTYTESWG